MLFSGQTDNVDFVILISNSTTILGLKSCISLKLIQRNHINKVCAVESADVNSIIKKYSKLFEGIGCFDKSYNIKLQDGAMPRADLPRRALLFVNH